MKLSGKRWFVIILKVTKNLCFTISLEDTFFEKPQEKLSNKIKVALVKVSNF